MPFDAGSHCLAAFSVGFQGRVLGMGDVNKRRVATCYPARASHQAEQAWGASGLVAAVLVFPIAGH